MNDEFQMHLTDADIIFFFSGELYLPVSFGMNLKNCSAVTKKAEVLLAMFHISPFAMGI